jgi:hypothetical protein
VTLSGCADIILLDQGLLGKNASTYCLYLRLMPGLTGLHSNSAIAWTELAEKAVNEPVAAE